MREGCKTTALVPWVEEGSSEQPRLLVQLKEEGILGAALKAPFGEEYIKC